MDSNKHWISILLLIFLPALISCEEPADEDLLVFTHATIWDGVSQTMFENAALVTRGGKVTAILEMDDPGFPSGAKSVNLGDRFLIPGLINAHGHVGMAKGLQTGPEVHSEENVRDQLKLYARYGITTVVSLGDEPPEAFAVRDEGGFSSRGMARLFMSGPVLNPAAPDEARERVAAAMQNNPDWLKIRVDDGLGTREKMPPEVYTAVIEASHQHNTPLAAHIVTLEDAKGVVESGADLVAHSVRDLPVDADLMDMMLEREVCITPTLTRELSVFIYADRPPFFDDPFFLKEADPDVIEQLQQPEIQQTYTGVAAEYYGEALPLAEVNMMHLHYAGVRVAMGTDSGPPTRFQGYFEHLEMEMMQTAGMDPIEVLTSATRYAAECMKIDAELGTLEKGKWADFLVLDEHPFEDVRNLQSIREVYIGGNEVLGDDED